MRTFRAVLTLLATAGIASCGSEPTAPQTPDLPVAQYDHINGSIPTVSGGGRYFSEQSQIDVTFAIHAQQRADAVTGAFHLRGHRDQGGGAIVGGEITCLSLDGNRAWLGGYILRWRRGPTEYTPMGFMVVDNGEGAGVDPDEFRMNWGLSGGDPPYTSAEDWCSRQPVDFTAPLKAGNIRIHH